MPAPRGDQCGFRWYQRSTRCRWRLFPFRDDDLRRHAAVSRQLARLLEHLVVEDLRSIECGLSIAANVAAVVVARVEIRAVSLHPRRVVAVAAVDGWIDVLRMRVALGHADDERGLRRLRLRRGRSCSNWCWCG